MQFDWFWEQHIVLMDFDRICFLCFLSVMIYFVDDATGALWDRSDNFCSSKPKTLDDSLNIIDILLPFTNFGGRIRKYEWCVLVNILVHSRRDMILIWSISCNNFLILNTMTNGTVLGSIISRIFQKLFSLHPSLVKLNLLS